MRAPQLGQKSVSKPTMFPHLEQRISSSPLPSIGIACIHLPLHTFSTCSRLTERRAERAISAISFRLRYRMSFSPGLLPNPLSRTTCAAVSCFSKRVIASSRVIFIRPFTLFFFILSIYFIIVKRKFE